jgi:hypothetical protein
MKNYTQYNYDELVQRMTDILRDAEGWGEGYQSSTGQTLIQLMADVTDNLHYMLERRTNENYLETAQLRSSVIARACELGYRYRRAVGNNGYVTIKIADTEIDGVATHVYADADITIPKYTKIVFDGDEYYTLEEAVIQYQENEVSVKVVQGSLVTNTYTVDEIGSVLINPYEFIDDQSITVSEGGVEYGDVTKALADVNKRALQFLSPEDAYFDIKYSVEGMRIVFGDGTFGKRPSGDVTISYIQVSEDAESIIATGKEFEFETAPLDLDGGEYEWSIENTTSIRGYQPPEDDYTIKCNAVAYHRSNGRAVTNSDYAFWTKKSNAANIVDAKAFGEEELESLVYNLNNVYITYLKDNGEDLTLEEHKALREFMDNVKTSEAHIVFKNAQKLFLQVLLDFKKNPNVPIADAEAYDIVKRFIDNYFRLTSGSIGKQVQSSDLIRALYDVKVTRNNIVYPVIDYAKVDLNGVVPFEFPLKTNKVFVNIGTNYSPVTGDEFVLLLENLICKVDVEGTDTSTEILTKMRDRILQVTPFDARVVLGGVAFDAFGNPLPLEIDPSVGQLMLIGVDTPYYSNTQILENTAIGSTLARVVLQAEAVDVEHLYYSSRAGRRPMIPLRVGTVVTITAPTDTNVNVYTRLIKDDPSTEQLITTINAGETYANTFNDEHILQFEYENDSYEDTVAYINYPSFDGNAFGLEISSKDNFGLFSVITSSGDVSDFVTVDYTLKLPVGVSVDRTENLIKPSTIRIVYPDGVPYIEDRGDGYFKNSITGALIPTGFVDYVNGEITLPNNFPDGEYLVMYDQDEFNNFEVDDTTAIQLIPPKASLNSSTISLSKIRLANGS